MVPLKIATLCNRCRSDKISRLDQTCLCLWPPNFETTGDMLPEEWVDSCNRPTRQMLDFENFPAYISRRPASFPIPDPRLRHFRAKWKTRAFFPDELFGLLGKGNAIVAMISACGLASGETPTPVRSRPKGDALARQESLALRERGRDESARRARRHILQHGKAKWEICGFEGKTHDLRGVKVMIPPAREEPLRADAL